MLSACATPPEVFSLSRDDVREITAVVNQRADIRKPLLRIASFEAGQADVRTGRDYTAGDRINSFEMAKRGGRGRSSLRSKTTRLLLPLLIRTDGGDTERPNQAMQLTAVSFAINV